MNSEEFMQLAISQAELAFEKDEVPVGAVIVNPQTAEIVACAYNKGAHSEDATSHAEISAIRAACQKLHTTRLWNMEMYVTLEPCTMCAAAISFARIKKLYFGAYDKKGGAVVNGVRFYDSPTCHHKPEIEGGICEQKCSDLLKKFFAQKR